MKKPLLMLAVLLSQPALAQEAPALSPLQQYLYSESGGYAPGAAQPVQQQAVIPAPTTPYDTAYAPPAAEGDVYEYEDEQQHNLNDGVRGMNF